MSEPTFHDRGPEDVPTVEIARYPRVAIAREHGLVFSAMELPYWIVRHGDEYALHVEPAARERAVAALVEFRHEEETRPAPPELEPLVIPKLSVALAVAALGACYAVQTRMPQALIEAGVADNGLIRAGQWWRCFTALTLHGGAEHIASNLSLACFAFAFVFWRFGAGFALLGIILGGALGNGVNALAHAGIHRSIGSSTALFAALGMLSGAEAAARMLQRGRAGRWPLLVPLGAGLAFLSWLGSGATINSDGSPGVDARVDVGAHFWGMLAGIAIGVAMFALRANGRALLLCRITAGAGAVGLLVAAWKAV